ncbi:MAG TPA: zf-TFIIB domain-containing protein [Pyrinomonadaceae bacterium]|nr:zf-TFIIB domain-containing protein [Pyrinomonadaceae bacterium]
MFDGENCYRCGKWHKFEELTGDEQGWSFCRRCAAKLSTEGKPRRRCPTDGREMVKRKYSFVLVDKCETCGGIWLDAGEQQALRDFARRNPRGYVPLPFILP